MTLPNYIFSVATGRLLNYLTLNHAQNVVYLLVELSCKFTRDFLLYSDVVALHSLNIRTGTYVNKK